ncbi:MAG: hypothetical protein ACI88H_002089 [Cocleimonas sp.]|jgi:hypothetical protein
MNNDFEGGFLLLALIGIGYVALLIVVALLTGTKIVKNTGIGLVKKRNHVMHKNFITLFLGISVGLTSALSVAEQNEFDIKKDELGMVVVSCDYADSMSSEYLQQIIGGPYTITNNKDEKCPPKLAITEKPKGPIIGGPGIPIPIGPRCKCPESYQAELQLRWMSISQEELDQSQQELSKQFDNR